MKESKFEISKFTPSGGKNIGIRKSEFAIRLDSFFHFRSVILITLPWDHVLSTSESFRSVLLSSDKKQRTRQVIYLFTSHLDRKYLGPFLVGRMRGI